MDAHKKGQLVQSAAEVYEEFFLPALFEPWAGRMADAVMIREGERMLDVACGTGVLAREAAQRAGDPRLVTGLDINEGMLAVARQKAPAIRWELGRAESMPFEDGQFDVVTCQFGLMFFADQAKALREMARVLRPGGRMAVAVWDTLKHTPGYARMAGLLRRLFSDEAAESLLMPYSLGRVERLRGLFDRAGFPEVEIMTLAGTARFPSIQSWVYTDIKGWTLANVLDDEQFERLAREAETDLREFVRADGTVAFDAPAHIARVIRVNGG